jgi:hypothetical protein
MGVVVMVMVMAAVVVDPIQAHLTIILVPLSPNDVNPRLL